MSAAAVLLGVLGENASSLAQEKSEITIPAKSEAKAQAVKGNGYYQTKDYEKAIEHFKRAFHLYQAKEYLFSIAQAYRKKGDCIQAIEYYESFLRKKPQGELLHDAQRLLLELEPQCALERKAALNRERIKKSPPQGAALDAKANIVARAPAPPPPPSKEGAQTKLTTELKNRSSLKPYAYTSWAVGLGALVTGAALIAIDEPKIKDQVAQPRYRPTKTPGIATAASGGALVLLGTIFYFITGDDEQTVTASIQQDGVTVGYQSVW